MMMNQIRFRIHVILVRAQARGLPSRCGGRVEHEEIYPLYISKRDMVADPFTKYLMWARHMCMYYNSIVHVVRLEHER